MKLILLVIALAPSVPRWARCGPRSRRPAGPAQSRAWAWQPSQARRRAAGIDGRIRSVVISTVGHRLSAFGPSSSSTTSQIVPARFFAGVLQAMPAPAARANHIYEARCRTVFLADAAGPAASAGWRRRPARAPPRRTAPACAARCRRCRPARSSASGRRSASAISVASVNTTYAGTPAAPRPCRAPFPQPLVQLFVHRGRTGRRSGRACAAAASVSVAPQTRHGTAISRRRRCRRRSRVSAAPAGPAPRPAIEAGSGTAAAAGPPGRAGRRVDRLRATAGPG